MKDIKFILAGIAALTLTLSAASCDDNNEKTESSEPVVQQEIPTEPVTESPEEKAKNKTITWAADFSLVSPDGQESSAALSLFRDYYGGEINYVHINDEDKYATLEYLLNCGDPIEIFVDGNSIVLSKFAPHCIFCSGLDEIELFKGKKVCRRCIKEMTEK